MIENLLAMQKSKEIRVRSLSWGDPLEEGMATCSNLPAWSIPWREELGALHSRGSQSHTQLKPLSAHAHTLTISNLKMNVTVKTQNTEKSFRFLKNSLNMIPQGYPLKALYFKVSSPSGHSSN